MSGPSGLYDLCVEFLEACEQAVAGTVGGPIGRVYVSPGPPPWDCDQITVYAGGPMPADTLPLMPPLQPGHRVDDVGQVNLVSLTATVIRCCVPVMDGQSLVLPDPALIEQAALQTLEDLWAIWNTVATMKRAGTLFAWEDGRPHHTREMFLDPAVVVNTSGGCAGWQIPIRVQISGYNTGT